MVEVYFSCYDESTFAERRFNISFVGVGQCILSGLEMQQLGKYHISKQLVDPAYKDDQQFVVVKE